MARCSSEGPPRSLAERPTRVCNRFSALRLLYASCAAPARKCEFHLPQFEQYRRPANAYFTLMAALSLTALSPFSPVTTFLPLGWVLGLSILKEGYEDFRRHKSDAGETFAKRSLHDDAQTRPMRSLAGRVVGHPSERCGGGHYE